LCCTEGGWLYAAADAGKPAARSGAPMHEIAQAFLLVYAGLFPIVNPVGSAPIFLALTTNRTDRVRHVLARRVAGNTFVLLLGSLFIGSHVLQFFGITIPVLRVAGGLAVASFGWRLLRDGVEPTNTTGTAEQGGPDDAFYPLTMPLTVGPGSIAVAIALAAQRPQAMESLGRMALLAGATVAGLAAIAVTVFFCYPYADRMVAALGPNGINVLIRLSAFILLCIGIQIIWSGYSALIGVPGH
jgi:multiple antibiotic resistance protein